MRPTAGRIELAGRDVTDEPVHARTQAGLGRTFQISSVFPQLSVLENVRLAVEASRGGAMRIWRRASVARDEVERARWALSRVGLEDRAALPAGSLPHGDKRKLELAMLARRRPAGDPPRRADGRRQRGRRAGPRRRDPLGAQGGEEDRPDGRAPHRRRHRARRADRGHAPRLAARGRHAGARDGERRGAGGVPGESRCERRRRRARDDPRARRRARVPRRVARAAGRLVRGRRGRRDGAARPERRREDDDAPRGDGARAAARAGRARRARRSTRLPTHTIVRRGVGYVPEDRDVFAGSASRRTCGSPSATRSRATTSSTTSFPSCASAGASGPGRSPAGSSRCSRSRARC